MRLNAKEVTAQKREKNCQLVFTTKRKIELSMKTYRQDKLRNVRNHAFCKSS